MEVKENLLAQRRKNRYNELPESKKKEYDDLRKKPYKDIQLKVIKRKRKYPEKGDVFILSPRENMYFFGLVVNNHVTNNQGEDWIVIMIFKSRAKNLNDTKFIPNFNNLLIEPCIISKLYWTCGYFYTVSNIKVPQNIDYGFYDINKNIFVNEYNSKLDHEPKMLGIYGITTSIGVTMNINREFIFDESLLYL